MKTFINFLKCRYWNALQIVRGPFQKQGPLQLTVRVRSALGKSWTKPIDVAALKVGDCTLDAVVPLHLQLIDRDLHLNLPQKAILRKATLAGWQTIWDGSQAVNALGLQLAVPAQGWLNLQIQSTSIDFYHGTDLSAEELAATKKEQGPSWKRFLSLMWSQESRQLILSLACHAMLLFMIFNFENIHSGFLSKILDTKPPEELVEEVAQLQVPVQMAQADHEFNGRGYFAVTQQHAETNFKTETVVKNLKGLKNLLQPSNLQLAMKKEGTIAQGNGNLANSLRSLQAGISKQGVMSRPGVRSLEGGLQVHWKSQFQSDSGSSSKSLNEGQQKILHDVFAKLQDRFRGCYETALLKFDEMSVTVSFEAEIAKDGRIGDPRFSVSGRSTPDSQEALLSCLKSVMGTAKVDSKLSGVRIKNQFIFKS